MTIEPNLPAQPGLDDSRKPWIAPAVDMMRAGDAEAGANPVIPEGPFGFGS